MTNPEWIPVESPPPDEGVYVVLTVNVGSKTSTEYVAMHSNKYGSKWLSSLYGHSRQERITHWRNLVQEDLDRFRDSLESFNEETQDWIKSRVNPFRV
jgi:hypothetical protein